MVQVLLAKNELRERPTEQIEAALRHGGHLVSLKGEVDDNALIKDVQWNTFGTEMDLANLSWALSVLAVVRFLTNRPPICQPTRSGL